MRTANEAHRLLSEAAEEFDVDLTKIKNLEVNNQMSLNDKDINEMGLVTLRLHLRDLIENIQDWKEIKRYKEKWKNKSMKKKGADVTE